MFKYYSDIPFLMLRISMKVRKHRNLLLIRRKTARFGNTVYNNIITNNFTNNFKFIQKAQIVKSLKSSKTRSKKKNIVPAAFLPSYCYKKYNGMVSLNQNDVSELDGFMLGWGLLFLFQKACTNDLSSLKPNSETTVDCLARSPTQYRCILPGLGLFRNCRRLGPGFR